MRLLDEVQLEKTAEVRDEFGGYISSPLSKDTIPATVSVKSDELRVKPSGLGYYRSIVVVVEESIEIEKEDIIHHNGVQYTMTDKVDYCNGFHSIYKGYEI